MNKKTIFKMAGLMLVGGVFGAMISLGLVAGQETITTSWLPNAYNRFIDASLYIMIGVVLVFFIPSVTLFIKGKKILLSIEKLEDEVVEKMEKEANHYMNQSLAINNILIALNFMIFGMTFDVDGDFFIVKIGLFMVIAIICSSLEIIAVRFMQKYDERLKGDPTSLKFQKDFLASLDEAEKLKIYESAYKAFQFTKNGAMVVLIATVLLRMTDFIGAFPVFVASVFFLMILGSYNYYAIKADGY